MGPLLRLPPQSLDRQRRTDFSGIVGVQNSIFLKTTGHRQRRTDFSGIVGSVIMPLNTEVPLPVNVGRISQVLWDYLVRREFPDFGVRQRRTDFSGIVGCSNSWIL